MISAVIFDRDGVLTDFDIQAALAVIQPLVPLSLDELIRHWIAWGAATPFPQTPEEEPAFWRGFWDHVSDQLTLSATAREPLYAFDYLTIIHAYPDARPALLAARAQGLRTGVLSNFPLATLGASLTTVGLADLIDEAYIARSGGTFKPDSRAYQGILAALQVAPEQCLYFDDEVPCVEGARALGMTAFLVDRQQPDHRLADGIVRDLSALPTILAATTQPK